MTVALHRQFETLGPALLCFAILPLRNEALAEDVEQDDLIAVLEKPEQFAGQLSLRTYVTSIMKHRTTSQTTAWSTPCSRRTAIPMTCRGKWGNPDATLEQKEFFRIMEICLERLLAKTAQIFTMRKWLGLETDEICKELNI